MKTRIVSILIVLVLLLSIMPQMSFEVHAAVAGIGSREMEGGQRDFAWPVPSVHRISGCFKDYRNHDAIDIAPASYNANVVASYDGVVYDVQPYDVSGYGRFVLIEHQYKLLDGSTKTLYTKYNHLASVNVSVGDTVVRGETVVGGVGNSGGAYDTHLDFQILSSPNWENYNYHNISLDPYVNDLLELPSDLSRASSSDCLCGAGGTDGCCCQLYIDYAKEQYSHPLIQGVNIGENFYAFIIKKDSWKHVEATAGGNVQLASSGNNSYDPKQIWHFIRQSDGTYKIQNEYAGKCLDAVNWGTEDGTYVGVGADNGSTAQRWYVFDTGAGYTISPSYCTSLCLDVYCNGNDPGTDIALYTSNGTPAQIFSIYSLENDGVSYSKPARPSASQITSVEYVSESQVDIDWTASPLIGNYDTRVYDLRVFEGTEWTSTAYFETFNLTGTHFSITLPPGTYTFNVASVNSRYDGWYTIGDNYTTTLQATHTHSYVDVTTPPTCVDQGYTTHTCSSCGDSYVDSYVEALGHDWNDGVLAPAPSCTEDGVKTFTCQRCGTTKTEAISATGHTPGESAKENEVAATCTTTGSYDLVIRCTTCNAILSSEHVDVPKTAHNYQATVTEPTCTEQGYTTHVCTACGNSYVDTYVDALGHDLIHHATQAPTCTAIGWDAYDACSRCNYTTYIEKAALGHDYQSLVTAPNCTEQGYTTHTCSRCGDNYKDTFVDALGHDFSAWTQTTAPTCTEKGEEKRTCSRCDAYETREIDALGHDYQAAVTEPTCTAGGFTTYTCPRCGDSYVADEVAALGHTPGAAVEENRTDPTCTANGGFDTVIYCSVCGVELSRAHTDLAALGHVWDDGVINPAATCTSDGVKTFTCQRCGKTKTEAIAATGHTPGESAKENEMAATCTTAGGYDMVIHCTVCNAILYTEHFEVDALGHDYQAAVTAPTCTEGGYTTYICSRCGDSYVADETTALGHDWSEWRPVPMNFCTDPRI